MKFNMTYNSIVLIIFTSLSFSVSSQSGPVLPGCPQCESNALKTQPSNGIWWNPDYSGVGLSIEIQGNKLLGVYYGYDDNGHATWYTFVGDLIESTQTNVMWEVDATINQFENGVCFNCVYQFPSIVNFSSTIHLQFNQANHATYSINGGEKQNIVPFNFGHHVSVDFPEQTDFEIPDFSGTWVFAEAKLPVNEFHPITAGVLLMSPKYVHTLDDGTTELSVTGHATDVIISVLNCKTYFDENNNLAGPTCVLFGSINDDGSSDNGYYVNLAGIGANKIVGKKANGDTIEAFKMEFNGE